MARLTGQRSSSILPLADTPRDAGTFPAHGDPADSAQSARSAWRSVTPAIAATPHVRISKDGGRTYPARHARPLPAEAPGQPCTVPVYDAASATGRMLVLDLDPGRVSARIYAHENSARIQLRVAVNVGPVATDVVGVSGEAIIVTARLVEAPQFKEAMERSQVSLGIIASAFIYETVIRHDLGLSGYSPVQVDVKESSFPAWMNLLGPPEEASREGLGWRPGQLIRT